MTRKRERTCLSTMKNLSLKTVMTKAKIHRATQRNRTYLRSLINLIPTNKSWKGNPWWYQMVAKAPQKADQAFSRPRSDTRKGGRGIVHRTGWYRGESVYQCVIRVQDGATFNDIIDESCAHWGLMPEYTFLEDNVSRTIWPGNAIVEKEIPLDKIRPELHLTFVQNLKLNELVVLSKKDQERKERIKLMQDQSKGDSMFENDPSSPTEDGKSEEEKDGGKSSESRAEFTKGAS